MKTFKAFFIIGVLLTMAACAKEQPIISEEPQSPETTLPAAPKTITFGSVIDWNTGGDATKASLVTSNWSISWSEGDEIAVANNTNNEIQKATITVDPSDATKGTFTINAVDGASTYYAFYPYSENVSFNHESSTFSGMSIGCTEYGKGSLNKSASLSMAGKASTSSSQIVFQPCLALVAVTIASNSISPTDSKYKAVTGFHFYQDKSSDSGQYTSGPYSVDLSGDNGLNVTSAVSTAAWTDHTKEIIPTTSAAITNDTYYFSIVPGGEINGMHFTFTALGNSYAATYTLQNVKTMTISPGDYLAIGPLDPVTKQQDTDSYKEAITVDGNMSDWNSITCQAAGDSRENYNAISQIKATADSKYLYVYLAIDNTKLCASPESYDYSNRSYLCLGNNGTTGTSIGNWASGYRFDTFYRNNALTNTQFEGWLKHTSNNVVYAEFINWNDGAIASVKSTTADNVIYYEMKIDRSKINELKNKKAASKAYVGFYVTDKLNGVSGDTHVIGYAPAYGASMLEVDVPAFFKW